MLRNKRIKGLQTDNDHNNNYFLELSVSEIYIKKKESNSQSENRETHLNSAYSDKPVIAALLN